MAKLICVNLRLGLGSGILGSFLGRMNSRPASFTNKFGRGSLMKVRLRVRVRVRVRARGRAEAGLGVRVWCAGISDGKYTCPAQSALFPGRECIGVRVGVSVRIRVRVR